MNKKKKLSFQKIDIAKLNIIRGGNFTTTVVTIGCGFNTEGLQCLYSQTPMSCQVCVEAEK